MKRIVVGVDGSPASRRALSWAASEALARHAELRAVAVATPRLLKENHLTGPVSVLDESEAVEATRNMVTKLLADAEIEDSPERPVHVVVAAGPVGPALLHTSASADLLVLGRGTRHKRLRSVGRRCERKATCPVLVVPG